MIKALTQNDMKLILIQGKLKSTNTGCPGSIFHFLKANYAKFRHVRP